MEGLFCGFFNFFAQRQKDPQRKCDNFPQYGYYVGRRIGSTEDPPAGQEEIDRRPQHHRGDHVKADLAVAGGGGVDKEGHCHHQPEQQVQHAPQQGEGDAHPHHPQQVVQQAYAQAQTQGPRQKDGLPRQRSRHISGTAGPAGRQSGPGRRPRRSARRCPPPLSGLRRPG